MDVIPKMKSSISEATFLKILASGPSWFLKKPITTTSPLSIRDLAASTVVKSLAGGPVFFLSHLIISSAVLPPKNAKHLD